MIALPSLAGLLKQVAIIILVLLLGACATPRGIDIPEPLREPAQERDEYDGRAVQPTAQQAIEDSRTPRLRRLEPIVRWPSATRLAADDSPVDLPEGPFQAAFEGMPLAVFIDEVFGQLLDLSFRMDETVRNADDRVTLRLADERSGGELYRLAIRVLASYGVGVYREEGLLWFVLDPDASGEEVPLLISGRTLPDVPASHRIVFHMVPLHAVRNTHVRGWLTRMFQGMNLEVIDDVERNAVVLRGSPRVVRQAQAALEVLDQPFMRGKEILRIDPIFRPAEELAADLIRVLSAQGYQVSDTPQSPAAGLVLPVSAINSVMVFSSSGAVLSEAGRWAIELDRPGSAPEEVGLFRYRVRNTSAQSIATVLQNLMSGVVQTDRSPEGERDRREPSPEGAAGGRRGSGLVVDEPRNAILFQGTGEDWQRLLPIMQEMDVPTRSVLVEVTIAEVTLSDEFSSGVEWAIRNARIGGFRGPLGTLDGLGVAGGGITWFPTNSSGSIRAVLQAFARSDRVSILSTPRLLVRSGESAQINVGTDIPIITSAATRPDLVEEGTSAILQQVSYRKTGILLSVEPIIHAGDRLDLRIRQEVSEARQTDTSGIDSPTILDRSIETSLSLRDGGSVMLGGLITGSSAEGQSRVPGLGRVPVLGRLFRTESRGGDRTELIVLIVPYILDDHEDAEAITAAFRRRLEFERAPNPLR